MSDQKIRKSSEAGYQPKKETSNEVIKGYQPKEKPNEGSRNPPSGGSNVTTPAPKESEQGKK